jgi:hypothetical protein
VGAGLKKNGWDEGVGGIEGGVSRVRRDFTSGLVGYFELLKRYKRFF